MRRQIPLGEPRLCHEKQKIRLLDRIENHQGCKPAWLVNQNDEAQNPSHFVIPVCHHNRELPRFVHVKLEHIGTGIVPHDIEIV